MTPSPLPPRITAWFTARGITVAVLTANNIGWNGSQIVIPVYDALGNFCFNKYRRDPFGPEDQPKYSYDVGAKAQLYGARNIPTPLNVRVIICEGELDALRLESAGYLAVSSTGGAGTFKDEWLPLFANKDVYICYDNDEAGIKGAAKLLTKLPAKLMLIPHEKGVKDITDYMKFHEGMAIPALQQLFHDAQSFPFLAEPLPTFTYIKDVEAQQKIYKCHLEHTLVQERAAKNLGEPHRHFDAIRELLLTALGNLEHTIRQIRYFRKSVSPNTQKQHLDLQRAKTVPIDTFLKVNNAGFAHCPFHGDDTTPSLRVYKKTNTWWCFACSAGRDVIDLVQKMDNCDFTTAVKKLLQQ